MSDPPRQGFVRPASRDPALDGLRGVAILLVYVFHYGGGLSSANPAVRFFGYFTQSGWVGVDVFFALSGFLITRLFWEDRETPGCLRNFYARRALRILPLYLGTLVLAAIVAMLCGAHLPALQPLLLYAAFLQNVPPFLSAALQYPPPLPLYHLWSLAIEEQFYLIWPLLLLACRNRQSAFRLCLLGFALPCLFGSFVGAAGTFLSGTPAAWSIVLPGRSGALALGGALAMAPATWASSLRRFAPFVVIVSLTGFIAVGFTEHGMLLNHPGSVILGLPCVEVFSASLVALTALRSRAANPLRALLNARPLRALGRVSYGFYVFHILLEPVFDHIGSAVTHSSRGMAYQIVRLLVAFPISMVAAWISYHFYEVPFLRLKRYFPHGTPQRGGRPHPRSKM